MPGPYEVTRRVYDFGDQVFQPSDLGGKVEITADVHFPTGLADGPYPLVLFLHGNHAACFKGNRWSYRWPCKDTWKPLPNYTGYDYVAARLASYGYVVVSVSGNGVNVLGNVVDDSGMRQRGELLEEHLDLWQQWSTVGGDPFGTRFIGKVDMTEVGTMGHSRGGEGVVWQVIVDRERPDPYGIDAVLPLAPVDFTRATINDVPLAVMLPYCDGDVFDLQGIHFYDDSRYLVDGDRSPKHAITVFGANHNFFNTVWTPSSGYPGAFDDGVNECQGRLRPIEERRVGSAYIVDYFRRYLGHDTSVDPVFTGAESPDGIAPARTAVSYLAPDTWQSRQDVDRFTDPSLARPERSRRGGDPEGRLDLRLVRRHVREPVHHRPRLVRRHPSAGARPRGAGVVGRTGLRAVPTPRGHTRRPAVRRAAVPHVDQPRLRREPGLPVPGPVGGPGRWLG